MSIDYDFELTAWGNGIVNEEEVLLDLKMQRFIEENGREPFEITLKIEDTKAYGLDYFYTGIDTAFLEKLGALKEIIMPDTISSIDMTPELESLLKGNDVLIRGSFDSFAESFAAEHGLHFRPADFTYARNSFEPASETTVTTLLFRRDGSMQVENKVSSPGSSAGNTFGGEFYHDLPGDMFSTLTAGEIIEKLCESVGRSAKISDKLADFIEKMKTHNVYMGVN